MDQNDLLAHEQIIAWTFCSGSKWPPISCQLHHCCTESMKIRVRGDRITISGIIEEAKKNDIEYKTIHDAGRTEIEAGSLTVLSLGPEVEEKLENLCSFLPIID